MRKKSINTLNILVSIGLVLTILIMLLFPFLFTRFIKTVVNTGYLDLNLNSVKNIGIIFFYLICIPYLIIIINLKKIIKLFNSEDLYNRKIIKLSKNISNLSFLVSILYILANIVLYFVFDIYLYAFTILSSIIIPFIFIFLGVLFLVISFIYNEIILIKEENDITI